jgi:hypothetical protein
MDHKGITQEAARKVIGKNLEPRLYFQLRSPTCVPRSPLGSLGLKRALEESSELSSRWGLGAPRVSLGPQVVPLSPKGHLVFFGICDDLVGRPSALESLNHSLCGVWARDCVTIWSTRDHGP